MNIRIHTEKHWKAEQAVIQAALDLARFEASLTAMRRAKKRCQEYEPADYDTGYPGSSICHLNNDDESICESCLAFKRSVPAFRASLKGRALAKGRLIRRAEKLVRLTAEEAAVDSPTRQLGDMASDPYQFSQEGGGA